MHKNHFSLIVRTPRKLANDLNSIFFAKKRRKKEKVDIFSSEKVLKDNGQCKKKPLCEFNP